MYPETGREDVCEWEKLSPSLPPMQSSGGRSLMHSRRLLNYNLDCLSTCLFQQTAVFAVRGSGSLLLDNRDPAWSAMVKVAKEHLAWGGFQCVRSISAHTAWLRAEGMWPGDEQTVGQEEASSNPAFCSQHCSEQVLRFTKLCLKTEHQPNTGLSPMSLASVMGLGALRGGRYLHDTQTPLLVPANCTCRLQDLTTAWEHCFCCDAMG